MNLSLSENTVPFIASDDWRREFETQCTQELLNKARRFAKRRARKLHQAGGTVDDYYTRELVQDVLGDTTLGVLRWDPDTESLEDHIMDAIATRVHHDVVRAKRFPHVSLDGADADTSYATRAAADAALLMEREASIATVRLAEDSFSELWKLAAKDPDLRRFLGALAARATSKADIQFVTGMSDRDYHAARNRLDRLIGRLSRSARPSQPRRKVRADVPPDQRPATAATPFTETPDATSRYCDRTGNESTSALRP